MTTTEILKQFVEKIDKEKTYELDELITLLTEIYDDMTDDDKPKKKGRPVVNKETVEKKKRAPSAYNKFVQERIKLLKEENKDKAAKELMGMAAGEWKKLSDEDKEKYK